MYNDNNVALIPLSHKFTTWCFTSRVVSPFAIINFYEAIYNFKQKC